MSATVIGQATKNSSALTAQSLHGLILRKERSELQTKKTQLLAENPDVSNSVLPKFRTR